MSNYEYFAEVQSEAQKQRRGDFWLINSQREEAGDEVIFWSLKSCCCCCCLFGTCSLQSSAFLLQCQGKAKDFEGRWAQWSSKTWPQSWCWGKKIHFPSILHMQWNTLVEQTVWWFGRLLKKVNVHIFLDLCLAVWIKRQENLLAFLWSSFPALEACCGFLYFIDVFMLYWCILLVLESFPPPFFLEIYFGFCPWMTCKDH